MIQCLNGGIARVDADGIPRLLGLRMVALWIGSTKAELFTLCGWQLLSRWPRSFYPSDHGVAGVQWNL